MQDTKLFEAILGVQAPWHISRVDLDTTGERVDIWAEHTVGGRWRCPDCDTELPGHDHAEERVWRHLDTCRFHTFLFMRQVAGDTDGSLQLGPGTLYGCLAGC